LYLRSLSAAFKRIAIDEVTCLKYLEVFMECATSCFELTRLAESPYEFKFGAKSETPPLRYFKSMVKFPSGSPLMCGLKWRQGQSPTYYSATFEGHIESKNVIHSIFAFLPRIIRKDLFENRFLSLHEQQSREPFQSKRTDTFFERESRTLS